MGTMRLYVGNISFKATEDDLRDLFSQCGEVVSVKLITDNATGRLRGFGFVEMASEEDGKKAINLPEGFKTLCISLIIISTSFLFSGRIEFSEITSSKKSSLNGRFLLSASLYSRLGTVKRSAATCNILLLKSVAITLFPCFIKSLFK